MAGRERTSVQDILISLLYVGHALQGAELRVCISLSLVGSWNPFLSERWIPVLLLGVLLSSAVPFIRWLTLCYKPNRIINCPLPAAPVQINMNAVGRLWVPSPPPAFWGVPISPGQGPEPPHCQSPSWGKKTGFQALQYPAGGTSVHTKAFQLQRALRETFQMGM